MRTLDSLDGITFDQIRAILTGQARLGDDSSEGISYVEETNPAHVEWCEHQEMRLVCDRGIDEWWEPYARVHGVNADDADWARERLDLDAHPTARLGSGGAKLFQDWSEQRCLYYADNPNTDRVENLQVPDVGTQSVVFRSAKPPAPWVEGQRTMQAALDGYVRSGRNLRVIGAAREKSSLRSIVVEDDVGNRPEEQADSAPSPSGVLDLPCPPGMDPEAWAGSLAALTGKGQTGGDVPPQPDEEYRSRSGYILPNGKFYGCLYHEHARLAERILQHVFGVAKEEVLLLDPEIEADQKHWIRVAVNPIQGENPTFMVDRRPTKAQYQTVEKMCEEWEIPFPSTLLRF